MVGGYVCLSCFQDHESCAWGVLIPSKSTEMNLITFLAKRFSPFVVFIIFYKCGIWAFLGCLACFICLVICCTDYGVICVYRGVLYGYLVDIAVSFCSYWSKMEYMSILSVQLWQGVLSSMLSMMSMMLDMVLFLSVFMACVLCSLCCMGMGVYGSCR